MIRLIIEYKKIFEIRIGCNLNFQEHLKQCSGKKQPTKSIHYQGLFISIMWAFKNEKG